jgi:hypothetical protein
MEEKTFPVIHPIGDQYLEHIKQKNTKRANNLINKWAMT